MKLTHRLLALQLALIMVISCLPLSVLAYDTVAAEIESDSVNPIAATYVSAENPDADYSAEDTLLFNGGLYENIIFVSYNSSDFSADDYLKLVLPIAVDKETPIEIFLLDGVGIDSENNTYNTLAPQLVDDASLGQYVLEGASTQLELGLVKDLINSSVFTIAVRSLDDGVVYYEDFEGFTADPNYNIALETEKLIRRIDTIDGGETYRGAYDPNNNFSFDTAGTTASTVRFREDPANSNNKVFSFKAKSNSGYAVTFNNFITYKAPITKNGDNVSVNGKNITGKTYRLLMDIKTSSAANTYIGLRNLDATSGTFLKKEEKSITTAWQTFYVDYTIKAEDFFVPTGSSATYTDVAFGMYISSGTQFYYIDNINVVEIMTPVKVSVSEIVLVSASSVGEQSELLADTYVSAENPGTPYGTEDTLLFNGGFYENVIFLSYSSTGFDADDILKLTLPIAVDRATPIEIFLLDGVVVDEEDDTYNTLIPQLATDVSLGTYNLEGDASELELGLVKDLINSSVFTIAVRSLDDGVVYYEDFEGFTADPNYNIALETEKLIRRIDTIDGGETYRGAYDPNNNFSFDTAGTTASTVRFREDPANSNNKVFSFKAKSNSGYAVTFNNFITYKAPITKNGDNVSVNGKNITGKTYRLLMDIKTSSAANTYIGLRNLDATSGTFLKKEEKSITTAWQTFYVDYTIKAEDFFVPTGSSATYTDVAFGMYISSGTQFYYIDNINVVEIMTPVKVSVSEIVLVSASSVGEQSELLADTYVSAAYPETVFGEKNELRLNGGKNEKIIFLTYSSDLVKAIPATALEISVNNDACVNAEIFLLDGYFVDEKTLNYNKMPDLENEAVSLGECIIEDGKNTIVLNPDLMTVQEDYFTLAIRATKEEKDVYVFDFIPEETLNIVSNGVSVFESHVVTYDGEDEGIYAYSHNSDGKIAFQGNLSGLTVRNDDTKGETYYLQARGVGAFSVFNSISDEEITKDENGRVWTRGVDITDNTYRFYATVRSNANGKYIAVGAGPSVVAGQYNPYNADTNPYKPLESFYKISSFVEVGADKWETLTVDYEINPAHIKKPYENYFSYPSFIIRASGSSAGTSRDTANIADLHTVELTADGKEREAIFSSKDSGSAVIAKLERVSEKHGVVSGAAKADTVNVFEFNAPALGVIKNAENTVDLVTFKKEKILPIISADPATGAIIIGNEGKYYSLCDENGNTLALSETETTPVALVYNDIDGTARYFVNKNIAYISKGGEHIPAVDLLVYNTSFAEDDMTMLDCDLFLGFYGEADVIDLNNYNFTATKINNDNARVIAYQESTLSDGIRIIAGLDTLYYTSVGFEVEIYEGGELKKRETVSNKVVYSSIGVEGETDVTAKEKGYNFLATMNIVNVPDNIPENSYIKIRSFTEIAGISHYDDVARIDVTNDGYVFDVLDDNEIFTKKQAVLLMGQSNMAGRGTIGTVEPISDSRITMLRANGWVAMEEPIHQDKRSAGVGLAASFAKAFVETFDQEIGLIPCAVGSTGLSMWQKDSADRFDDYYGGKQDYQLYANAVAMAKQAMADGTEICAILWHQGENDYKALGSKYGEQLKYLLDGFIKDIGLDPKKVIVITGELGPWVDGAALNKSLHALAESYSNYGVAESDGLINKVGDAAHFTAASYRVLGYRYFDQFYNLVTGKNYDNFVDDYTYYEIKTGEEEDTTNYVAKVDFNNLATGTYSADTTVDNITISVGESSVDVIATEGQDTEKYVGVNLINGKTSPFVDIATSYQMGATVITEARFSPAEAFGAEGLLLQLVGEANIPLVMVGADGILYNVENGEKGHPVVNPQNQNAIVLEVFEWVTVKVVADLANNTKDIYVDGVLCISGAALTDSVDFAVESTRLLQFNSGAGAIYVDDFKSYAGE